MVYCRHTELDCAKLALQYYVKDWCWRHSLNSKLHFGVIPSFAPAGFHLCPASLQGQQTDTVCPHIVLTHYYTELQSLFHTRYILLKKWYRFLFFWMCTNRTDPLPGLCSSPALDHVCKTQSDRSWQTRSLYSFFFFFKWKTKPLFHSLWSLLCTIKYLKCTILNLKVNLDKNISSKELMIDFLYTRKPW